MEAEYPSTFAPIEKWMISPRFTVRIVGREIAWQEFGPEQHQIG